MTLARSPSWTASISLRTEKPMAAGYNKALQETSPEPRSDFGAA